MTIEYRTSRRRFLQIFALGISGFCLPTIGAAKDKPQRKPNIIYINADDLGWTDLTS